MNYTPIILFTYCRPRHTKQTVEALLENSEASNSDLIIYSDGPKNEKAWNCNICFENREKK